MVPSFLLSQTTPALPPPSTGGFFPLAEVHRGLKAVAWTVFTGTQPEPMDVEILGVLRGARGPGHDMILAQLHGSKPEYTGVVAGMSGSPVYVGNRLMGALAFRIGQFSKDPIAGITPIEQMLEVRDLPLRSASASAKADSAPATESGDNFQAMETPLTMSGFRPEAIQLWKQKMAGTGMAMVAAGGSGTSEKGTEATDDSPVLPGSAVSALLIRGDLQMAATCTVTYVDPQQLLACGHPILQAGPVSIPMTKSEVLATLASPMNAFKIVNTGATIGAFTEDRDAAIRGVFQAQARMIPVHLAIHGSGKERKLNYEVLDLPALTPQAMLVSIYNSLLETNASTADTSFHMTGKIQLEKYPPVPLDIWAPSGDTMPATMIAALLAGDRFNKIYGNNSRLGAIQSVELNIEEIPRQIEIELDAARLVGSNIVHAGETVVVEATVHGWQQPRRNVRIPFQLPARLAPGTLRLLISDSGTLDKTLNQPRNSTRALDIDAEIAQARRLHPADRIYISLFTPETQAGMAGRTLTGMPLSMANALEPLRVGQDINLNGETLEEEGNAPAGGFLNGFQILNLRIEAGAGLN